MHICGKTEAIWESIKELNISAFSLDNEVDIGEANRFFGDKIAVTGNIPPVDVIYNGSQEEIEESVRQCIEKAYDTPAGFVIAPGCNLPISTPIENVGCFMDAARKYGQYDFGKLDSNREIKCADRRFSNLVNENKEFEILSDGSMAALTPCPHHCPGPTLILWISEGFI